MTIRYWNKTSKIKTRTIGDGFIDSLIFGYIVTAYDHVEIVDLQREKLA